VDHADHWIIGLRAGFDAAYVSRDKTRRKDPYADIGCNYTQLYA
jgi:hypothetical protein